MTLDTLARFLVLLRSEYEMPRAHDPLARYHVLVLQLVDELTAPAHWPDLPCHQE